MARGVSHACFDSLMELQTQHEQEANGDEIFPAKFIF